MVRVVRQHTERTDEEVTRTFMVVLSEDSPSPVDLSTAVIGMGSRERHGVRRGLAQG